MSVKDLHLRLLRRLMLLCVKKPSFQGLEHIDRSRPIILVSNHWEAYGPIIMNLHFPIPLISWVNHKVADPKLCPEELETKFVREDMGLKPPFSRWLAVILSWLSVSVMRYIKAIPVYRKSRKIMITIEKSVDALKAGSPLLVFPEVHDVDTRTAIGEFDGGFVNIARDYFRDTGKKPVFYPVCVHKKRRVVAVGPGVAYEPGNHMAYEKQRLLGCLRQWIVRVFEEGVEPAGEPETEEAADA